MPTDTHVQHGNTRINQRFGKCRNLRKRIAIFNKLYTVEARDYDEISAHCSANTPYNLDCKTDSIFYTAAASIIATIGPWRQKLRYKIAARTKNLDAVVVRFLRF